MSTKNPQGNQREELPRTSDDLYTANSRNARSPSFNSHNARSQSFNSHNARSQSFRGWQDVAEELADLVLDGDLITS